MASVFLFEDHHHPLIISSALGILFNLTGIELYEPVMTAVDMLASASLGLGLILVGAGLKIADALNPSIPVLFAVVLKLIVMPVFMVGSSALLGIRGMPCSSSPWVRPSRPP